MISNQEVEKIKQVLEAKREDIKKKIAELSSPVDMGDDIDSFDEETDEAEEFSTNAGKADAFKKQLADVEDALLKIEGKTFGKCEKCGKPIEKAVLDVDPESRLCISCKEKSA